MNDDEFGGIVESLMRSDNADSAAAELQDYLADEAFVEHLLSAEWGDEQAAIARFMRYSLLADVIMLHPNEQMRSEAVNWLSDVQDEDARLVLIDRAAHDEADLVRAGAAEAIADQAPQSRMSEAALRLLADEEVLVRSLAVYAAMQQGAEPAVRDMLLTESEERVIVSIHCALAADGDDASVNELYLLLANSDYMVRYSAMNGLAQLASVRDTPRFHDAILDLANRDAARAVSVRAREICGELGLTVGTVP
ncbi:MAG: hypothetical protein IPG81_25425 [Sandaracinaceae bacterium]|jgi:HEAT repeat protein|nr:hypothetical protein [Sandaracinaceae bacterium]